jgi:DNA-binding LytR/AlgR family response regulator
MIEIAICDDDPSITGYLETIVKDAGSMLPEPLHIQVFHQGTAFLAALNQKTENRPGSPFDIIFLDIELGDTTGLAVAEQIRKDFADLPLIFISAHEDYCKQLFRFNTTAFLEKPINAGEVKAQLLRICKNLRNPLQVFISSVKDDIIRTPLRDILYFESRGHKIEMVTKTDIQTFYGKLDEVEAQLKHPGFVRIHYSQLVNLDNVERFEKSVLFLPGGRRLPLARARQKEVRRKIMDYYTGTYFAGGGTL